MDHRSIFANLSNWKKKPEKNQGFNGIEFIVQDCFGSFFNFIHSGIFFIFFLFTHSKMTPVEVEDGVEAS